MPEKSYVGLELCFFCQEACGVVLDRRLRDTLPRQATYNHEPCAQCVKWMAEGVIFISVDDQRSTDKKNPYRTGGWAVIKEEAVRRIGIQPPELLDSILKQRVCFVTDETWDLLNLPRAETGG